MKKLLTLAAFSLAIGTMFAQPQPQTATNLAAVLRPHFTEASIKIPFPDAYSVACPEIHDGLIAVTSGNGMGTLYYALDGKCVYGTDFPIYTFDGAPYFRNGVLLCQRKVGEYDKKTMLLSIDGTYRDVPTGMKSASGMSNDFSGITPFVEGIALAQRGDLFNRTQVFIDENFKEIAAAPKFSVKSTFGDMTLYPVVDNRRLYYNPQTKKYGYLDSKGATVIASQFDKAHDFSDGMAAVQVTQNNVKRWGFIDMAGKLVIPATYHLMPGRFTEGVAPVRIGTDANNCVMNYIDKSGNRLMPESVKRTLNEFHDGYAWVGNGCDGLYVIDRSFAQTRDMTADFYHNGNGFGACSFKMTTGIYPNERWGIDFPGGMQALNQDGCAAGDIFKPDGTLLYAAVDGRGYRVNLNYPTAGGLMLCQVRFDDEPRFDGESTLVQCFINTRGEIVYYFVQGFEGFEGTVVPKAK